MFTGKQSDKYQTHFVLTVFSSLEEHSNILLEFARQHSFAVDLEFALVVLIEFASTCVLYELRSQIHVHFDLFLLLTEFIHFVELFFLADELHFDCIQSFV